MTGVWETVRGERRVLVVVRTPAAWGRLGDVLPGLLGDLRVEVVFTVDEGSVFAGGLEGRLKAAGAVVVPWGQACREKFDLAVAASDNGALHLLNAPLVLMPHGAGYHRRAAADPTAVSGLAGLVKNGRVVPHTVVVAHERQVAALKSVDPRVHAVLTADPCLDRITASAAHRHRYRRAFDADGRRMVLLCSTWGPHSLFGTDPRLAERLVSTLPADEYRVAMTLHPNVWQRHGPLQVRAWLRQALAAGLALVPPGHDWRQAMVAADLVISDHGSLTSYAAAAGKPILLAADGGPEVIASPLSRLLASLPRLPPDGLPDAIPTPVDPATVATIFHRPGTAAATMNALFYRIMDLPVADPRPAEPIPPGEVELTDPTHYRTTIRDARTSSAHARLTIRRTTARHGDSGGSLSAADTTPDIALLESASAIWADFPFHSRENAVEHIRSLLSRLPGARLATAKTPDGTVVAAFRDGSLISARTSTTLSATTAALHWWSTQARRPRRIEVDAGAASGAVEPR
ncbi:hypothetical protein SAMN04487818_101664 [Actinokineospora terrae]|uniref:CDP-Glycerol:Poly(Glycerophosphate) glycerophosphotransferase n=1 Tax=Actinokineospora terrae TaxID=155974 RepID=A0A1H9LN78_9PSEU|nr:hypothetical protein SAMN04487818_101664 [Actinokineospora terrae]